MDIRKYLIICISILLLVGCSPAWAVDDIESNPAQLEVTDPAVLTINDDVSAQLPLVDVSEQSIQAIAETTNSYDGVQYSYQYVIEIEQSQKFIIDTNIDNFFELYDCVIHRFSMNNVKFYVWPKDSDLVTFYKSNSNTYADMSSGSYCGYAVYKSTYGFLMSFDDVSDLSGSARSGYGIEFATCHIFDSKTGNLLYESSFAPPIPNYVYFNTGIEGYDIDRLPFDDFFELPVFEHEGYRFIDWYLEPTFETVYYPEMDITEDITLYAKTERVYTINFVNGFFDVNWESTNHIDLIFPDVNIDDAYNFVGWFLDSSFETPYYSGFEITDDITLYAKYTEISAPTVLTRSIFDGLTSLFEVQAIKYILSLMVLVVVIGIFKILISTRI